MSKTKRKFPTNEKRIKRKLEIISARQQLSYEVERAFAISVVASRIDVILSFTQRILNNRYVIETPSTNKKYSLLLKWFFSFLFSFSFALIFFNFFVPALLLLQFNFILFFGHFRLDFQFKFSVDVCFEFILVRFPFFILLFSFVDFIYLCLTTLFSVRFARLFMRLISKWPHVIYNTI